jgi:hypothetical protein
LCGRSAGLMSQADLTALICAGVDTFVCLQQSYTEYGCNDYRGVIDLIAKQTPLELSGIRSCNIRFLHCPIPDFGVVADESMIALISELTQCIKSENATLYIHCYGGHGRTGTVIVNLLEAQYGVDPSRALALLQARHRSRGCRGCALNHAELEADVQIKQAGRIQGAMSRQHKIS